MQAKAPKSEENEYSVIAAIYKNAPSPANIAKAPRSHDLGCSLLAAFGDFEFGLVVGELPPVVKVLEAPPAGVLSVVEGSGVLKANADEIPLACAASILAPRVGSDRGADLRTTCPVGSNANLSGQRRTIARKIWRGTAILHRKAY